VDGAQEPDQSDEGVIEAIHSQDEPLIVPFVIVIVIVVSTAVSIRRHRGEEHSVSRNERGVKHEALGVDMLEMNPEAVKREWKHEE
jgi:hypothetical protein